MTLKTAEQIARRKLSQKASSRKQYAKNKVRRDATIAAWRAAHPDKVRELRWRAAVKRREQLRAESAEENLRRRTQTNDWKKAHPEQVKARLETYRKRKAIRAIHRVLETLSGICVPAQKLNLVDSPPAKPVG